MNASDVMTAGAITIGPDANVQSAAKTMLEKGVSALPVVDQSGKLIGIISEGDLIRRTESGTEEKPSWWLRLVSGTDTAGIELREGAWHPRRRCHEWGGRDRLARHVPGRDRAVCWRRTASSACRS